MGIEMKVELSNRHVDLDEADLSALFGPGYELTVKRMLGREEFAANETVTVIGDRGELDGVRVLGPCRRVTQVELLAGDCRRLGINAPVLESVSKGEAAAVTLRGPCGTVKKENAAIIAHRHVHLNEQVAAEMGITDGQVVRLRVRGVRGLVFENVLARLHKGPRCMAHIDTEEGNAAGCNTGDIAEILT